MKKIYLLLAFVLFGFISIAQISIDSIGFKAYDKDINIEGKSKIFKSDILFFIDSNGVTLSSFNHYPDQTRKLTFIDDPYQVNELDNWDHLVISCKDAGGFKCTFYLVYDKKIDSYIIGIKYNNAIIYYGCKITNERPWDNDPIDYLSEGKKYRENHNYTDEELDKFFSQFGNPELIRTYIINQFYKDLLLETEVRNWKNKQKQYGKIHDREIKR